MDRRITRSDDVEESVTEMKKSTDAAMDKEETTQPGTGYQHVLEYMEKLCKYALSQKKLE
jgi:hypothetical protein